MARTISRDALEQKISKLETAISKNRQQYDQLTKELKELLVHQIENLKANGITNIIIIVGYLGDVIKDYFSDGSSFGVNISYFIEEEPLGTAGALRLIQDRLEDNFVLVFGDLYINIDFQRFWNYHIAKKAAVSLFAHPNSHPQDSDILVTNDEMQVTECINNRITESMPL